MHRFPQCQAAAFFELAHPTAFAQLWLKSVRRPASVGNRGHHLTPLGSLEAWVIDVDPHVQGRRVGGSGQKASKAATGSLLADIVGLSGNRVSVLVAQRSGRRGCLGLMLWCLGTEASLDVARGRRTALSGSHSKNAVSSERASSFRSATERRPRPTWRFFVMGKLTIACKSSMSRRIHSASSASAILSRRRGSVARRASTKSAARDPSCRQTPYYVI